MANPIPLMLRIWKASWGNDLSTQEGKVGFWADFGSAFAGYQIGKAIGGPIVGIGVSLIAPYFIEKGALAYSAPFTALSIRPVEAEAKRVHRVIEQRRRQKMAMSRMKPTRGPTFASPGHVLMRCPPGYHLKDGACIED